MQSILESSGRQGVNTPLDEGILESVHVVNFMCHANYVFDLNPLINFICGKNGSGKSAILTAITLCLGGKAADTNRSKNLAGFIKSGKDQAIVSVGIRNRGDNAYLPEVYGDTIVVERTITRHTSVAISSYKLKSATGRTISNKRADLDEISDYFNLQISNPMNVLSQDNARQFIGTSSPQEKYKFFVKGIQLEQLDTDYRLIENSLDSVEAMLGQKQDDVQILKTKMNDAKRRLEMSDKQQGLRNRLSTIRNQLAWSQVIGMEEIRDDYRQKIAEHEQTIAEAQAKADELDRSFQAADHEAEEARVQYEQATDEVKGRVEEKKEAKARQDEIKAQVTSAQASERQIRESLMSHNSNIKTKKAEIEAEKRRLAELDNGGTAARHTQLEQAEEEVAATKQAFDEHVAGRADLVTRIAEAEQECKERKEPLGRKRNDIAERESRIQNLNRDRNRQDSGFHPNTAALLRAIENERSFAQKPVGPMGKYIRLLKPEWSSIVEKSLGGSLGSFVVTSKGDQAKLNHIMHRVKCVCPILIGNNHPLDTTPNEPDQRFDTILRILGFDNDLVRKQLVIHHAIEQSILIPDVEEASRVLYSGPRPRNIRRCMCFQSASDKRRGIVLTYTRHGEASQDPIDEWRGAARLQTDMRAQVRLQEEALQQSKQQLNELENTFHAAQSVLERANQALTRHGREEHQLRVNCQKAEDEREALRDAIEEDSVGNGKLITLQEGLHEQEEAKKMDEGQYQDAVEAKERKKIELSAAKKELTNFDNQIDRLQAQADKKQAEAQRISKRRAACLTEKNAAIGRIEDGQRDQQSYQVQLEDHETALQRCAEEAAQVSPRVEVPPRETHATLNAKYEKLSHDLQRSERHLGSREEIARRAAETEEAYRTGKEMSEGLVNLAQNLKQTIMNRRARWKQFQSMITARARCQFFIYLANRGFTGKLIVDHKSKQLIVHVEPDINKKTGGRTTTSLSGGEKSFSQICLLLAIWEAMGSPIRCLDEFDVYMDSLNRRMSIELLINAARSNNGRQFIFITPGSRTDIKLGADVSAIE